MSHYGLLQDDWGKKMVASGFSNVLMITCSMTKVINGKIYSQALTCQKTLKQCFDYCSTSLLKNMNCQTI